MYNSSNFAFRNTPRDLISEFNMTSIARHSSSFGGYVFSEEKKWGGREDGVVLPSQSTKPSRITALQNESQTAD
jgi:hypothetical protein